MEEKNREGKTARSPYLSLTFFSLSLFRVLRRDKIQHSAKNKRKEKRARGREVHNHSISRESVKKGGPLLQK
jgi:hypothetical protein